MSPYAATDLVITTALATLFAVVGVLCIAAAVRWRAGRATAVLLAWAMLQHILNLAGSDAIQSALQLPRGPTTWIALAAGYFVAVPWALLVERAVGPGWMNSIRRTCQVYLGFAIVSIAYDIVTGHPGAMSGPTRIVVAAGALVGFANVSGIVRMASDLRVLRVGYLVFMAMVVHDALASAGLLYWNGNTGPLGVLVFILSLAYTVVSRGVRAERELRAFEQELGTARRIQTSLLPAAAPRLDGAALVFRYVPAAAVAGDIFEFLGAGPRRAGILVADVSGHGVPAALIASMVKVAAAAQRPHADDPSRVLAGIHLALADQLPNGQFVTAVYVHVDLDRGILRHASAGHPPALVCRAADGTVTPAGATGPLLISFAPPSYPITEIPLHPGDRVVLYTDGVVEAMREDGEMFGVERLSALMAGSRNGPDALLTEVTGAVSRFAGRNTAAFEDDCTLVALEVAAAPEVTATRADARAVAKGVQEM